MAFRLRKDARTWFKSLEGTITTKAPLFEYYYFCLSIGFAYGQKAEASSDATEELVRYFPDEFRTRGRIITALLISKELQALGISFNERTQVYKVIRELVDPQSPSFLSEYGMQQMNRYASGGFEVLSEKITDPPRTLPAFLINFRDIVAKCDNVEEY